MIISKYISHWFIFLSIIWFILYYLKSDFIKYFNIRYISIVLILGYLIIETYYTFIKKYEFECSFLLFKIIIHILPIIGIYLIKYEKNEYALETLLITIIFYLIYLSHLKKNFINIYFVEKYPKNWNEVKELCDISKSLICYLIK